jgi:SM-20-related protein
MQSIAPSIAPSIAEQRVVDEETAAGLARGEHVVLDAWLGSTHARALRLEILALMDAQRFRFAGVGAGAAHVVAADVRRDTVCWFDRAGAAVELPGVQMTLFFARVDHLVEHLNGTCFLALTRLECHAACFEAGAFYREHVDAFAGDTGRVISFCYYLNDAWDPAAGGCLRLHGASVVDDVDVAPILDRLVVFRSAGQRHEVLPTSVQRLSLTGWLSTSTSSPPRQR